MGAGHPRDHAVQSPSRLLCKQWYFRLIPAGGAHVLEFYLWDGTAFRGVAGSTPVTLNQWSHVAAVYDKPAQTVTFHVNGTPEAEPFPYAMQPYPSNVDIGAHSAYNEQYLKGIIDEASFYSSALTAAQVQAIYNADDAGKCKP